MSRISNEDAQFERCAQLLEQAQHSARQSQDRMRIAYIDGESARFQAFDNVALSKLRWDVPLQMALAQANPPIPLVTLAHLGDLALDKQDFPKAQSYFQLILEHSTQRSQPVIGRIPFFDLFNES